MKKTMNIWQQYLSKAKQDDGYAILEHLGGFAFYAIMVAIALGSAFFLLSGSKLSEVQTALFNVRSSTQQAFAGSFSYNGLDNAYAIKAGLIPKKLIRSGNTVLNPYGGSFTIAPAVDNTKFTITLDRIPEADCTKLATYQYDTWDTIEVNGTMITTEMANNVVTAGALCLTTPTNKIVYTGI